jgi:hypothetical protein
LSEAGQSDQESELLVECDCSFDESLPADLDELGHDVATLDLAAMKAAWLLQNREVQMDQAGGYFSIVDLDLESSASN